MEPLHKIFLFNFLILLVSCAEPPPTLYEYYTSDGISSGLSVDQPYFTLNGKNISLYSGGIHYFRVPPQYWQDRLRKLRAAGLNTVETYIPWNLHEPINGTFDFGAGGSDWEAFLDIERFLQLAQEEDLLVILRPGPYICAEWEWGGFPSYLLREDGIRVRTADPIFTSYVQRYFDQLLPILAKYQFTQGGPVIMFQVENEYGYSTQIDPNHVQQLYEMMKAGGLEEILFTTDGASSRSIGSFPGIDFQTVNFGSDAAASFSILEEIQPNKPLMAMEFYPGWYDRWSENHNTQDAATFRRNYEEVLAYPGSLNLYMFHGGTSFGFLSGANIGPSDDNSVFQPITSSYDYDAPLSEAGDYTEKYDILRELLAQYNPVLTLTPEPPALKERQVYPTLTIDSQMNFIFVMSNVDFVVLSTRILPMEYMPLNYNSGQSYGYIVYRQPVINISANSVLTITGHVRDDVMVLINGVLISRPLSSSDDLNNFGFWKLENSNITLTTADLTGVTLDLVVENWGRANVGNIYQQFKGLLDDNIVYIDDEEQPSWLMYPLEFKKSWINEATGWEPVEGTELVKGPGLYKATLTLDEEAADYYSDTFIDMREWNKGFVAVNGFVLGKYASVGPQQTLYLPGPFLHQGDNDIVIFEHFAPASEIKFVKNSIFSTP